MNKLEAEEYPDTKGSSVMCGDIDRQQSDTICTDGTAYDCLNLRRHGGMLEIVEDGTVVASGANPFGSDDIVFCHHSALDEGWLIVGDGSDLCTLSATLERSLIANVGSKIVGLSAFGNILIVNTANGIEYFIYMPKQKEWRIVSFDAIAPKAKMVVEFDRETWNPKEVVATYDSATRDLKFGEYYLETAKLKTQKDIMEGSCYVILGVKLFDGNVIMQSTPTYLTAGSAQHTPDTNWEAFTKCGASHAGAVGLKFNIDTLRKGDATSFKFYGLGFTKMAFQVTGVDTIEFNRLREAGVIQGIVAYATRPTSNYQIENTILKNIDSTFLYKGEQRLKLDLEGALPMDEPFYLVEDKIILGTTTELGAKKFENITSNEVLRPNLSRHKLSYESAKPYNDRLHFWGTTQKLCDAETSIVSYDSDYFGEAASSTIGVDVNLMVRPTEEAAARPAAIEMEVDLIVDGKAVVVRSMVNSKQFYYQLTSNTTSATLVYRLNAPEVYGYPDSRAIEVRLYACLDNTQSKIFSQTLTQYNAINQSLYCYPSFNRANARRLEPTPSAIGNAYYWGEAGTRPSDSTIISKGVVLHFEPRTRVAGSTYNLDYNKIYVSELNNPFYVNPANVYTIGSFYNSITALEPAIEQLSEGRFGDYPLYLLSHEGVFALQTGSNVLYQSISQVSLDRAISPTCVTGVGNGVVFLSDKGIMFASGRQVKEIGQPITTARRYSDVVDEVIALNPEFAGLMESKEVKSYLKTATASVISNKGEVLFSRPDMPYAYVLNVGSGSFYRRTLQGQVFKAGSQLLLAECTDSTIKLSDLEQANPQAKPFLWVSRPIKLGSLGYKKLANAILRLYSEESVSRLTWTIFGSIDGREYKPLNMVRTNGELRDLLMGRAKVSVRYFAIAITGKAESVSIDNHDLFHVDKFSHRPR